MVSSISLLVYLVAAMAQDFFAMYTSCHFPMLVLSKSVMTESLSTAVRRTQDYDIIEFELILNISVIEEMVESMRGIAKERISKMLLSGNSPRLPVSND